MSRQRKDLIVLVADSQMEQTMRGLLSRTEALSIRQISFDIRVHPHRDGGCRNEGVTFLRMLRKQYHHALLLFDHEGCGREKLLPAKLESQLEQQLANNGWSENCAVIVLNPELEIWVWSSSRKVDEILGWSGQLVPLRNWLLENGYLSGLGKKPERPKEALHAAMKEVRKFPSAAIFNQLARSVRISDCQDRAFLKLRQRLQAWFAHS